MSALTALATHLEIVSKNNRGHGGHGWTYDEEIEMLRTAASEMSRMHDALAAIEAECSGALNNGFPEDAPETVAHIQGIAVAFLPKGSAAPSNVRNQPRDE